MFVDKIDKMTFDGVKKTKFLAPLVWMLMGDWENSKDIQLMRLHTTLR